MGRGKDQQFNLDEFRYVDCFHINPQSGKRTKWVRLPIDKLEEFRNQWQNYNVFSTVQLYRLKTRQEGGGEFMYAPLFFDIDSSRLLAKDTDKTPHKLGLLEEGSVHPAEIIQYYQGTDLEAHLNNFAIGIPLPDDVCKRINAIVDETAELRDFVWIKNLEEARKDAVKLIHFFRERFGLTEDEIRVYFSGSKGFHILVNPVVLGIQPDKNLHRVFKYIATYLESQLDLRSLDTSSIYGHGRMLRMINSMHHKSGRFKVELYHHELMGDLWHVINNLARAPRMELYDPASLEYSPNELAREWYLQQWEAYQESTQLHAERPVLKDEVLSQMEGVPVCVQFILDRGILKAGDRNKATMALASYYKDIGTPMEETINILTKWAEKIPKSMTSSTPSEVRASTISCIKTVYTNDTYHFGCAFIRSLHGERKGRDYEAVPCAGRACPAHEDHTIDNIPAEHMHLAKTADAQYTGKKVSFDALVSGKMDTPYIVPKKVRFVCAHEPFCEKDCIMHDYAGLMEREFHENERFLIEATNQSDERIKNILFHYSRASCKKVQSDVLETENVTEMLVVPMADRVMTVRNVDDSGQEQVTSVDESGYEYVSRKIYAVGKPDQIPSANQHYTIEGFVYSHPRNAMATILTQKHIPKADSVSQFRLTEEVIRGFEVFKVAPGETLDDRISLIISDLVENVTLVRERFEPHLAVLMTYHSCLHYYFQDQLEKRGWMETIFVGDSGQAKTQLVSSIMEFCGLGNLTSGEGSSRTGLVYMLEQINERWFIKWGSYPLSDRKLIAIDEFSELNPEDFGKITEARTTGVLKLTRAGIDTETNARVRLILLTNPANARTLASFTHGVESLKPLFASPADIRRLDLAVFLQSGDVPKSVLNAEHSATRRQLITSEVLRNSVLWAWSRRPEQIEITPAAMKRILQLADVLGDKYGYAQDIPLMEPSDLRKKLARMSIALAALVHSTDEEHEKVIVLPEHVEYVSDFVQVVYDNKNARLDVYAAKSKEETELTPEERAIVDKALNDLDFADSAPVSAEILDLFRKNEILKPVEIIDMLGYERGQVNSRLSILTKHSMITRTRDGLRKLPKFIEFLNA
jgi:hypothetical protein